MASRPDNIAPRRDTLDVLVIEEQPAQCERVRACLDVPGREHVQVRFVHTVLDAVNAIRETRYNCILVGHELPDGRGLDILEELADELMTTPVIGLSSVEDASIALEYFRAGCSDFFIKREVLDEDKLRRGIARAMARFHMQAMRTVIERRHLGNAIVKSQEGLIALARTDRLMGICNRNVFDDHFATYHAETVGRRGSYALCLLDVDNFKKYNDNYGHVAGDQVLRQVARALDGTLRDNDFIARYGGEEIVVLLDEVDVPQAASVAERLRRLVADLVLAHEHNPPHGRVTVSIGVAVFDRNCAGTSTDVLVRADEALYEAKRAGRNAVVVARPDACSRRIPA